MARSSTKERQLIEQVVSLVKEKIDREAGIIYGVKVCGLSSKNNRKYTPEALKKAASLYERVNVNIDHPVKEDEQTPLARRFGYLESVRYQESPSPGLYANLVYNPKHSRAEEIIEAAERMPHTLGLSHNAYAKETKPGPNNSVVIESIAEVKSVDLVADPATVNGLFESIEKKPMKDSAKKLIESACNFKFQRKLLEQFCKDQDNCKRITEEVDIPETDKPEEIAKAVFEAVSFGVIKDGSLSPADKAAKIDALATLQTKLLEGEQVEVKEEKTVEAPAVVAIGVAKAGQLCESLKFTPNIRQLTLISEANETTAKLLAEEFCRLTLDKPEKEPAAGRRVEPVQESEQVKPAQTAEELASRIA